MAKTTALVAFFLLLWSSPSVVALEIALVAELQNRTHQQFIAAFRQRMANHAITVHEAEEGGGDGIGSASPFVITLGNRAMEVVG
ncbi:MAG: hypothetical protein HQL48_11660 [Gammaproteobacteria bacterium]|nr:hypothetical protein [Gammaproteobacteria bacterium]